MPTGFGSSPYGSGPYGFGQPTTAAATVSQLYTDPTTGTIGTGRKIDPTTRQYVYGSDGNISGQGSSEQLMYLALATVKGSSILADLGETYSQIDVITDSFQKDVEDQARAAVQSLVDQKKVEVQRVLVERYGESAVKIQIVWRDRTTGLQGTITL